MSKERKANIAKAVTSQLRATEEAIDTALAQAANLIETYVTSRRAVHMSTIVGNDVHQNTLKAMMALSAAQQHMTAAHDDLSLVRERMGLSQTAIGPIDDKPDPKHPRGNGVTPVDQELAA